MMNRNSSAGMYPVIYSYEFSIEKPFYSVEDVDAKKAWLKTNLNAFLLIPIVYVILTLAGREYMKKKPKYELRLALIWWNIFLAAFSILGSIRFLPG
jgi:hypothetical protein